jgi:hypothetical protein
MAEGCFATSDNDYFFKPLVAMIYLIFIVIYLLTRFLRDRRPFSSDEYVTNALAILSSGISELSLPEHRAAIVSWRSPEIIRSPPPPARSSRRPP